MIPERKWGQLFDPRKLTIIAKFIIEKHQPAFKSYAKVLMKLIGLEAKIKS